MRRTSRRGWTEDLQADMVQHALTELVRTPPDQLEATLRILASPPTPKRVRTGAVAGSEIYERVENANTSGSVQSTAESPPPADPKPR